MQERLFDDGSTPEEAVADSDHDPYATFDDAVARLLIEFVIDEEHALDAILGAGSEAAARRMLQQRWWLGEVELRETQEAA